MQSPVESGTAASLAASLRNLGCEVDERVFAIGRPDRLTLAVRTPEGRVAVAKAYPLSEAAAVFAQWQCVWGSSFGQRRVPPGMPEPLRLVEQLGVVLTERIAGQPLAAGALDPATFDAAVRLIAELHDCDARPERRRSSRGILRSLGRKFQLVSNTSPDLAERMRRVLSALEAARAHDAELVPSHGDCSPRNVLAAAGRLVLVDWDRLQWADPARDLAYFGTWNWKQDLRQGRAPDRNWLARAVAVYDACRPHASVDKRLPFHVAAGLVRQTASIVQLWPEELELTPALLDLALNELK